MSDNRHVLRLIPGDPVPDQIIRATFVPFLPDGRCILVEGPAGPALPAGDVLPGEDYLIDTVLRVWLRPAAFRCQHLRPFGLDGGHLFAWVEGAPYTGNRGPAVAELGAQAPERAAERLRSDGQRMLARVVLAAAASYRTLDDEGYYADNLRTVQRAYLRGRTPQEGSGFLGSEREWRQARHHVSQGIGHDGSFLDIGCANGLLMESIAGWCAERGLGVVPYGIDLVPGLVEQARRRLPQHAQQIWVGNAIDWRPPGSLRFDYVHVLLDSVPRRRQADLIRHHLRHTVRPVTGRLLVSAYAADGSSGGTAAQVLGGLGFRCSGESSGDLRPGQLPAPTAWIDAVSAGLLGDQ